MGKYKVRQVVWVTDETFAKVLQLSSKLNLAPNATIARILDEYFEALEKFAREPEKEVVIQKIIVCPSCLAEFKDVKEFLEHIKKSEKCKEILKKMVEEK